MLLTIKRRNPHGIYASSTSSSPLSYCSSLSSRVFILRSCALTISFSLRMSSRMPWGSKPWIWNRMISNACYLAKIPFRQLQQDSVKRTIHFILKKTHINKGKENSKNRWVLWKAVRIFYNCH